MNVQLLSTVTIVKTKVFANRKTLAVITVIAQIPRIIPAIHVLVTLVGKVIIVIPRLSNLPI